MELCQLLNFGDTELFRDIPGWNGYKIGRDGSVWSFKRRSPKRLIPTKHSDSEYLQVTLSGGGTRKTQNVHWLVLAAFCGPKPPGLVRRHLDGNPRNNAIENLAYGTVRENIADSVRHGTIPCGEKNGQSKYSQRQVDEVRELHFAHGVRQSDICRKAGLTKSFVSRVCRGKAWSKSSNGIFAEPNLSPNKKLSDLQVIEIRESFLSGSPSVTDIATKYGVSKSLIYGIKAGKMRLAIAADGKCVIL